MLEALALTVISLSGLYFCILGTASLFAPNKAISFLLGFASSPRVHYIELSIRLLVGASLVIYAPRVATPGAFSLFGWILLVTTTCLLLLPWRWHHQFAKQAVPRVTSFIKVIGIFSLTLGGFILAAVYRSGAA